jgi:hypothetical protein
MKLIALLMVIIFSSFIFYKEFPSKEFKELYKIEGVWKMKTKKGDLCESWKKMNDVYLQNRAFMIKANNDTMWLESVSLTQKNNAIVYTSTVANQNGGKAVAFKLTSSANQTFVFENAEHDFPKRITYQFIGKDSLHAWIDGGENNKNKRNDFYYKKQ